MGIMITAGYTGGKAFAGLANMKDMMSVALFSIIAAVFIIVGFAHARKHLGLGTGD